jgi:hypothetical protein
VTKRKIEIKKTFKLEDMIDATIGIEMFDFDQISNCFANPHRARPTAAAIVKFLRAWGRIHDGGDLWLSTLGGEAHEGNQTCSLEDEIVPILLTRTIGCTDHQLAPAAGAVMAMLRSWGEQHGGGDLWSSLLDEEIPSE